MINSESVNLITETEARRLRICLASVVIVATLTALAGCGGDNLLLPSDGQPAQISLARGNDQTGTVGQPLGDSLVVLVTDPGGRPVKAVEVVFVPPTGATVEPSTVLTGTNGEAAVHYTLSTTAGEQPVEAHAATIVPASASIATFTTTAEPESAEALIAAGGEGQSAQVSTALAESLAVQAVDRFGNGVAGIEVTWQWSGGGAVSPQSVTTGPDGRAATERTLGDRPGAYATAAKAEGLEGSPVSFNATAVAAPRPELVLVTEPSSTAAAGVALQRQPELQLQDPLGAPLSQAGVSVTVQIFSGAGTLGGRTKATSDANGRVVFTDLAIRGETGSRTLIFAADGFTPAISASITVNPGPPAASRSSASVPDGTAGAPTTITLHLKDEFGNPVAGASAAVSVTVGGANPAASLLVADHGDGSYSASYAPIHSGVDQVGVRVNGTALAASPFNSKVAPGPADASTTTAVVTRTTQFFFFRIDIVVTTRDAQGNLRGRGGERVQVQVDGRPPGDAQDNGDGTYVVSFTSFEPDHIVAITLNGIPIAGSPYTPTPQ